MTKAMWEILIPNSMPAVTKFTETVECPHDDIPINRIKMEWHHGWDEYVRNLAGGLTILRTAKGEWVSKNKELFRERMK